MKRSRIIVRDLTKTFRDDGREVAAVQGASFEILDGEFVAIVGPSGCGKSTILNMIGGLVTPTAGAVEIDGVRVAGRGAAAGRLRLPEGHRLSLAHRGPQHRRGARVPRVARAEQERRVREAIELAGLAGFEEAFPATLSGGMRQRVALMRTLVVEPEILLMDEPFGALDTHTKINLHAELLALWESRRQTVVFVTHDLSEAITLADRIVVMTRRPGRVKMIHAVKLPRPRDVIKLRETDAYAHEYGAIWHVLGEEFAERAR